MKTKLLTLILLFAISANVSATTDSKRKEVKIHNDQKNNKRSRSYITPPIQAFIDECSLTLEFTQLNPFACIQIIHVESGNIIYMNDFMNPQFITIDLIDQEEGYYKIEISIGRNSYMGNFDIYH